VFPWSPSVDVRSGRLSAVPAQDAMKVGVNEGVGLEFLGKLPWAVGRARGHELAIGNTSGRSAWLWIHHSLVPAYRLRAKRENGCGYNNPGTRQACSANQLHSKTVSDQ